MIQYKILPTTVSDAEKLIDYLNAVAGETDFLSFGKDEFFNSIEEEEEFIQEILNEKSGIMLVAKNSNNEIIAGGTCFSNKRRHSHVFTMALTVKKTYWRNGIGTQLIHTMEKESQKLGCSKMILYVYEHNKNAIALYKKLHYFTEGILKDYVKINGKYFDTLIMSKHLD